jgi:hypothetical protein
MSCDRNTFSGLTRTLGGLLAAGFVVAQPAGVAAKAPAGGEGGASGAATANIEVRAYVPALCFVQGDTISTEPGQLANGGVMEACNKAGGYTVVADYRPLDDDEDAVLQYDGQSIDLPHSGEVVLHVSSRAAVREISYAFSQATLDQPLSLSLSITPA